MAHEKMKQKQPLRGQKLAKDILPSEKPALSAEKQKKLNYALLNAAGHGDNKEISRLLKAGADIKAKDHIGDAALYWTVARRHPKACALIILEYAKRSGDVRKLINAKDGADRTALSIVIDAKPVSGRTALCIEDGQIRDFLMSMPKFQDLMGKETFFLFMKSFGKCISGGS